jgi:hypothetical protein
MPVRVLGKITRFLLGVDKLVCANDKKELKIPYYKLILFKQHPFFTWGWMKQFFTGDQWVLRFHDQKCFEEFVRGGRLKELIERVT